MTILSRRTLLLAGGGLAAIAAAAEAVRRLGRHEAGPVSCGGDPEQLAGVVDVTYDGHRRGALFEPANVSTVTPCPLILLFDPLGLANCSVSRYARAARERGWIVASSYEVANGTNDDADTAAMLALLDFVRSRRAVDPRRVFAGGFSGGACGAYRLAIVKSEIVRGAIVECGHMGPWRSVGDMTSPRLAFYLFTRECDFNRQATRQLQTAMAGKRCRVVEVEKPGGHVPMEPDEVGKALGWLESA